MKKCLHILLKKLNHLQHELDLELQSFNFMHNKLINSCRIILACKYACYKSIETMTELINDLRSSIVIYNANFIESTFFTDRRYHKSNSNQKQDNRYFNSYSDNSSRYSFFFHIDAKKDRYSFNFHIDVKKDRYSSRNRSSIIQNKKTCFVCKKKNC